MVHISTDNFKLRILCHELDVELLQSPQHLLDHLLLWEDGCPEVEGSRLLPKAGAWDDADAGCFQETGGVEDVSWLAGFLGSLHGGNQLREG